MGIQNWLDLQQRRALAPPGSQPLAALQRAAGLCGQMLRAFGRRGARLLDRHGVAGGLAATLSLMGMKGLALHSLTAAAGPPLRAVCAVLVRLLRLSDEAGAQLTRRAKYRELTWEAASADARQVGQCVTVWLAGWHL